jgi:hypothetical protein
MHSGIESQACANRFEFVVDFVESRFFVPRINADVTYSASPSFSSGSNNAPASKYPLTTTEGLLKFERVRTVIPLGRTSR